MNTPPLPDPICRDDTVHGEGYYTAAQMYAHAQAAYAAGQAAGPIAFTPSQRRRLWDNSPEHHKDAASFTSFERLVTLTERAHAIRKDNQS